jgi:hypothetical protein
MILEEVMFRLCEKPCLGNALGEYGLVGSLVVLVCIAGFISAGGSLNDLLSSLKGDMDLHRQAAIAVSDRTRAVSMTSQDRTGQEQVDVAAALTKNLTKEEIAALGSTLPDKLQTLGANGTTELLSRQLAELARQLLDEGKISPDQSAIIMRMANQGFRIAEIESMVEDATRMANGDMNKLKTLTFNFQGETQDVYGLASKLGFNARMPQDYASINILDDYSNAQYEMASFLNFYQQAKDSGLLNDPAVRATIESAASQIASTGEAVETILYTTVEKGEGEIPSYDDFKNKIASKSTSMDSSRICTSGNFTEDGVSCNR